VVTVSYASCLLKIIYLLLVNIPTKRKKKVSYHFSLLRFFCASLGENIEVIQLACSARRQMGVST